MQKENAVYLNLDRKDCIETTFKEMGIRAEKSIAEHILKENVYGSNLISDISSVDYTKGHLGETHLREIQGFPIFVDDLYAYGYLRKEDIVYNRCGGICCTTGENGAASYILEQIRAIVKYTIGSDSPSKMHIHFMNTISLGKKCVGTIEKTIQSIEKNSDVRRKWKEYNNGEEPEGAFVVKIDVSNVPLRKLQDSLSHLETKLLGIGYSIYCVDYTQDYSGTMSREKLVSHFLSRKDFQMQKEANSGLAKYTILDNTDSVGRNVLTYIHEDEETGNLQRVKFYNKIVSNFEAGEVRSSTGGHLADYVFSSNERLRKVFATKDVQERGITRLEVSVYRKHACISGDIGSTILQRTLDMVSSIDCPLFAIQPAKQQWNLLAEKITKCFALVERVHYIIYLIWYGNSYTGRLVGIKNDYSKKKDKENIEDYIQWAIADFGFKMVPIWRADILSIEQNSVRMSPLLCYVKKQDSSTLLAPCNRPLVVYTDPPDISFFLPSTPFVDWKWRSKKEKPSDSRKPKQELVEMPEIANGKKVSMLSVKQRATIEEEIREAKEKVQWMDSSKDILKSLEEGAPIDIENIRIRMEAIERRKKLEEEISDLVEKTLDRKYTRQLGETPSGKYAIVGWASWENKKRVVVQYREDGKYYPIWPNTRIRKLLDCISPYFYCSDPRSKRSIYAYIPIEESPGCFLIDIRPKKWFYNSAGTLIGYFPVEVADENNYKNIRKKLQDLEKETEEIVEQHRSAYIENVELPKDAEKHVCRDIPEGSYKIQRISKTSFRGKQKTYLHLASLLDGKIQEEEEKIVSGYYIEEEWKRIEEKGKIAHPAICRLGIAKTNPNKRKFRTCQIDHKTS